MLKHVAGFVAAITLAGCLGHSAKPASDPLAEARAIRALDSTWVDAVTRKDVETVAGFYSADGVLMGPNAPAVVGRVAIKQWFEGALQAPNLRYSFTPVVVDVATNSDLAYDRGTYEMGMDTPKGRVEDRGKYVAVWKMTPDGWKVVADILNSDLAPSGS